MKRFHGTITCDQCVRIVNYYHPNDFVSVKSRNKRTDMHFCNERCKLIFFKGRSYYKNKLKEMEKNGVKAS